MSTKVTTFEEAKQRIIASLTKRVAPEVKAGKSAKPAKRAASTTAKRRSAK